MRRFCFTTLVALFFAIHANAQSVTYDFESGGDQGFGNKFSDDASASFPIVSIGGSNRMEVLRNGDFQEADRSTSNPLDPQYLAMTAAANDEAGYLLSYDWYVDTSRSPGLNGSFLQLGTYVNTGSSYYAQDFPGTGKDVELNGTQLASGSVFSGTVAETFSAKGYNIPTGETFFRVGLIINGDGPNATVYFDNISIRPIPEPASMGLVASAIVVFFVMRRRATASQAWQNASKQ